MYKSHFRTDTVHTCVANPLVQYPDYQIQVPHLYRTCFCYTIYSISSVCSYSTRYFDLFFLRCTSTRYLLDTGSTVTYGMFSNMQHTYFYTCTPVLFLPTLVYMQFSYQVSGTSSTATALLLLTSAT